MNNNFTTLEKLAIIKVLSHIMTADGIIHPKEEEYMDKVYIELDIKICDLENMSDVDDITAKQIIQKLSEEQRQYAQKLFVSMAKSDGYIHPKESILIKQIFQ